MPHSSIHWVDSNGGPLLLLAVDLLPFWDGINPPADGRVIAASFRFDPAGQPCDYDRACDVTDYLAPIPVATGHGVILGGEPTATAWLPAPDRRAGTIVRWVMADDEHELLHHAQTAPAEAFTEPPFSFQVGQSDILLFDSAEPGREIRFDTLTITLPPGHYLVSTARYQPNPRTEMILHRFTASKVSPP